MTTYAYDLLSQAITKDGAETGFVISKDRGIAGSYHVLSSSELDSPMLDDSGYGWSNIRLALEAFREFDEAGQPNDWLHTDAR